MNLNRHELRTCVFLLLYQKEFYPSEQYEEQQDIFLNELMEEESVPEEDRAVAEETMERILPLLPEIDARIEKASEGWRLNRIAKAELAVLRLGVYEMLYDEEVPVKVAINEAVELAREYGRDKGYAFVNGILDTIRKEEGE